MDQELIQHQAGSLLFRWLPDKPFIELWRCAEDGGEPEELLGQCDPDVAPWGAELERSPEELERYAAWFMLEASKATIKDLTENGPEVPWETRKATEADGRREKVREALELLLGAAGVKPEEPYEVPVNWARVTIDAIVNEERIGGFDEDDDLFEAVATILGVAPEEVLTIPKVATRIVPQVSTDVETSDEPKYPAELLTELADALACEIANPMGRCDGGVAILDRYTQEVGRENIGTMVAKALSS